MDAPAFHFIQLRRQKTVRLLKQTGIEKAPGSDDINIDSPKPRPFRQN